MYFFLFSSTFSINFYIYVIIRIENVPNVHFFRAPSYICPLFTRHKANKSGKVKMLYAERLLPEGEYTVSEVVFRVAFNRMRVYHHQ